MKRIPNIKLTEEELYRLLRNSVAFGGESVIVRGQEPATLSKIFVDQSTHALYNRLDDINLSSIIDMSDNKLNKIAELYRMELEDSVQPLATLSYDGRLIGYQMTHDEDDVSLGRAKSKCSQAEIIHYLEYTKDILEYYATKDITYGDVAARNILINRKNKKAKFCDIDNIRLGEYGIDLLNTTLEVYGYYRELDASADAYMHNLLTLGQFIDHNNHQGVLAALKSKNYPREFKWAARRIMRSMTAPETFTGEYVIQYVKK